MMAAKIFNRPLATALGGPCIAPLPDLPAPGSAFIRVRQADGSYTMLTGLTGPDTRTNIQGKS